MEQTGFDGIALADTLQDFNTLHYAGQIVHILCCDGSMGFTPAVQLSFLKKKEQKEMLDAMEFAQCTPSLSQALRIKKLSADGNLTVRDMEDILSEIKQKEIDRVVFKTEQLHRFFPVSYTAEQMRREILEMLKLNMNKYWDE